MDAQLAEMALWLAERRPEHPDVKGEKKRDPAAAQHSPLANQFSHRSKDAVDTAEKGNT